MIRFNTLLKLNMKRSFKALAQLIFGAAALIFLVSAVAFCGNRYLYGTFSDMSDDFTFSLAVIMEDDSNLANKVIDGVLGISEVNSTIDFHFTDKETAINMLEADEALAALVIPKDTAHNIVSGKNTPMTVIFPENSGFEAVLIKEVADAVATMLSSSQAGIYSICDFYELHDADEHIDDALMRMNLKYINVAATGNNMFDKATVTATGSIPLMTYYICVGLVLFALLFGINCYSFLQDMPVHTSKRLTLKGTSLLMQGISEYLSIAAVQLTAILIVAIPAISVMKLFDLTLSASGIMGLIVTIPVFVLVSSAVVFAISKLTPHNLGRIMLTFFSALVICFISGCFIPEIMLPDVLQTISRIFPAHYMISFASDIMAGVFDGISLIMCILFAIFIFLMGLLFSWIKRRKELC